MMQSIRIPMCMLALCASLAWNALVHAADLEALFRDPPQQAKPWVFWYWMHAAVTREGITADLEAMREAGIGGAYLMPIKGVANPPHIDPPAEQLSPPWWEMVRHAMREADRLGLEIAMHASDGFAVAGGPWITPELSMQKLVWTQTQIDGGQSIDQQIAQPSATQDYYRDIALLAMPAVPGAGISTRNVPVKVTTSLRNVDPGFLIDPTSNRRLQSTMACWIQYEFDEPFTCRSITIRRDSNDYQSNRLIIEASDDGQSFRRVIRLEPPRHGWQDGDAPYTHSIPETTARFFRFVYDKSGSEPGSEDLDSAKWRPELKLRGIELSAEPRVDQFEGKSGAVWRVSRRTSAQLVPDALCVDPEKIIDITQHLSPDGRLSWDAPPGQWTILRIGHTSTGHRNETGGAGRGLECDKFNPQAVRIQFDGWFGKTIEQVGPELAGRALKIFHVDSWEAGSQNWSPVFRDEFIKRRGYDPVPLLPIMAGIPLRSAEHSENFLHDVRLTIAELVNDSFFATMSELARGHGCVFSAECVAPTMTSDGLRHYSIVDLPMGEFWLNSPTHDKPNDILDAISGARIYGKPIVQAEAFTTVRMDWSEHPGMLKSLGDLHYAMGINRFVYHVYTHNPWLNRRPGMTLDGVGLYFQRDQTWWKPGRAWVKYAQRCQALLQQGRPVVDIAVFAGEEIPSRAVRPEQLVTSVPGLFEDDVVEREKNRLANVGEPTRQKPRGVTHSANMTAAPDWIDPLRGYAYDSINADALMRLATVRDGRIVLPGGASYGLLIVPGPRPMNPHANRISPQLAARLNELRQAGASVVVIDDAGSIRGDGPPRASRLPPIESLGIPRDFIATGSDGGRAQGIAWTHRATESADIYFVSNQHDTRQQITLSLRVSGKTPELWDPVAGEMRSAAEWSIADGRTILPLRLEPAESIFVVLRQPASQTSVSGGLNWNDPKPIQPIDGRWSVRFDPAFAGPAEPSMFERLESWSKRTEPQIRHYSGTAEYSTSFQWNPQSAGAQRIWLDLGQVANLAEVTLNGIDCGVAWTAPHRVEITRALRAGENDLRIAVTNTWANRLIGDRALPEAERTTWTTAPYRLDRTPLRDAGLLGPVVISGE